MRTALLAICALIIGFAAPRLMPPIASRGAGDESAYVFGEDGAARRLCNLGANVNCGLFEGKQSSFLALSHRWHGGVEGLRALESLPNLIEVEVACELSPEEIDYLVTIKTIQHVDISLATLPRTAVERFKERLPSATFFGERSAVFAAEQKVSDPESR